MWRDRLNSLTAHIFDVKKLDLQIPRQTSAKVQAVFLFRKDNGFSFNQCSDIFSFMNKECLSKISQMDSKSAIELIKLEKKMNKLVVYFQNNSSDKLILSNLIKKITVEYPTVTIVDNQIHGIIQPIMKAELEKLFNGKTLVF